ncbi:MAG: dTDP-4-dehydrorhamnose reductase [Candidatus Andersenbacteria bacterium]|nr:dTDP-4-dehydrorhamnose reductase [bacterium]MDZ4225585.1 dTDP-4-dehydrorhamnose reductase [Candidatus Andersenbacteria bacterium]
MAKVLIVGGNGMLGHALRSVWAEAVVGDKDKLDITKQSDVNREISELSPELIINAAAYTNVDGAEKERDLAFAINETGVRNLALAAKESGAILVHYSTDYVFNGKQEAGYGEDDEPGPAVNVYGESKLAGEKALREIAPKYYLLRTAWLYGAYGKNFVETMLRLVGEKKELGVVNDQWGSPTYTMDLAGATKEVVSGGYEPGVYHAVNSGRASWYDFAVKIFELAGMKVIVRPIASSEYPLPAARPKYSILNNTRGPVLRPWETALDEYIKTR